MEWLKAVYIHIIVYFKLSYLHYKVDIVSLRSSVIAFRLRLFVIINLPSNKGAAHLGVRDVRHKYLPYFGISDYFFVALTLQTERHFSALLFSFRFILDTGSSTDYKLDIDGACEITLFSWLSIHSSKSNKLFSLITFCDLIFICNLYE